VAVELGLSVAIVMGAVLVTFLAVVTYNHVVSLQRRCQRAWANIDVALKQRHDQLPALVAAVRGAMHFEEEVLEAVSVARSRYEPEAAIHDQAVVSEATSEAVRSLFAVAEGYPELRSHANVMALQVEIGRLETLIAQRRELFNDQVYLANTAIDTLPGLLLKPFFGWKALEMFRAADVELAHPARASAGLTGP
jgi:LemA protein